MVTVDERDTGTGRGEEGGRDTATITIIILPFFFANLVVKHVTHFAYPFACILPVASPSLPARLETVQLLSSQISTKISLETFTNLSRERDKRSSRLARCDSANFPSLGFQSVQFARV